MPKKPRLIPPNAEQARLEPAHRDYYKNLNWHTETTPSQIEEARNFLGRSLGWYDKPPIEGSGAHWEDEMNHLKKMQEFSWLVSPAERATVREDSSPEFLNAVESLKRQHPVANTVTAFGQDPKMEEGVAGKYYGDTGYIALSTNPNDKYRKAEKNPDSYRNMMGTLRHELGHHIGATDNWSSESPFTPVHHNWSNTDHNEYSAYDIGRASDQLTSDIYLPLPGLQTEAEEEALRKVRDKYRSRKGEDIELFERDGRRMY